MQRELHATSIYVTHDQVEAMTMADRIVVMHGGVVQQIGAPLDLYDRPANSFVAGFLGSPGMNFLEAKISRKGDVVTGVLSDGQSLPVEAALPVADDEPVMIGLRPEHLSLSDGAGLKGKVDLVEQLGMATQFYVNFAGKHVCVLTVGRVDCVPGQQVTLSARLRPCTFSPGRAESVSRPDIARALKADKSLSGAAGDKIVRMYQFANTVREVNDI